MTIHYHEGFAGLPQHLQPSNLPAPAPAVGFSERAREGAAMGGASETSAQHDTTSDLLRTTLLSVATWERAIEQAPSISAVIQLRERINTLVGAFLDVELLAGRKCDALQVRS